MGRLTLLALLVAGCAGHATSPKPPAPPEDDAATAEPTPPVPRPDGARPPENQPPAADGAAADREEPPPSPDTAPAMPPPPGACAKLFGAGAITRWAHYDSAGKLVYDPIDERGDRIMDYSSAGYRGGGVALPVVPVAMTIGPSGGDDSAAIQAAIDAVSQRPLQNGFRGALLLKAGKYTATKTLTIAASGVVLRGSGAGLDGTVIDLTDLSHLFLDVRGPGKRVTAGAKATITDGYVPAGARSFSVDDASSFKIGDAVLIGRPVTPAWIHFMGMDTLVRDGAAQSWIAPNSVQTWERTITALDGAKVTLDIPLSDSFDGQYLKPPGASMQKFTFDGRLSEVGLESFRVTAPVRSAAQAMDPGHGGSQLLNMTSTVDSWIKGLVGHNTVEGIHIESGSLRITVEDTVVDHDPTDYITSSAPFDFSVNASQVLVHRSSSLGGNKIFSYANQHALGPNVVLNFTATGRASIQPHQRWSTGLLVDNASDDQAGTGVNAAIAFMNRGTAGSGHGWSQGWGVAWNCTAPVFLVEQPPGSMNWGIGCKGTLSPPTGAPGVTGPPMPNGVFESMNAPVAPSSLYLAQLCERLGPTALANIGYPAGR